MLWSCCCRTCDIALKRHTADLLSIMFYGKVPITMSAQFLNAYGAEYIEYIF